jgi:hypothetical protein
MNLAPIAEPAKRNSPRRKKMDVFDLIAIFNLVFIGFVCRRAYVEIKAYLDEKQREARRHQ